MLNKKTLLILILVLFSFSLSIHSQSPLKYTTSGTFTVPAGVTTLQAECWGGGGGGGGADGKSGAIRCGGGGSGGTYTKNTAVSVNPLGTPITVTVGAGGAGGTNTGTGGTGGTSTFASTTPISAIGGNGGAAGIQGAEYGNGGAAPVGVTYSGGAGANAASTFLSLGAISGGGGGSAGSTGNGIDASGPSAGGAGPGIGGAGAAGLYDILLSGILYQGNSGISASEIGGGGGGAFSTHNNNRTGGAGGPGQVIVTWTCPTYSLTSTSATTTCLNNSSTVKLSGLPAGTYNVSYSLTGSNTVTGNEPSMTVSQDGTGTFTINTLKSGSTTITITNLSSGTSPSICSSQISANNTASISIQNTLPTAGTIGTTQTICYNTTPIGLTNSTSGTGDGTISYRWETNTNLVTPSWAPISGQTIATYAPGVLTATTQYRRITISTLNSLACESAAASIVQVNVNPNFTSGAINTTGETICYNGDPVVIGSATASSGGDNSITYKWQANGVDIPSSNTATYDPPSGLTSTTTYTRYAKDGTCNTTFTASTGSWMVTVRPNSTSGAINTTGETICYNGNPGVIGSATDSSGGDNSITYKWQANGVDIPSSNTATYDPPSGLSSTTTYTRYAKDGTCNTTFTASTGSWIVTVRPNFTSGAINTTGETICYNGNPGVIGSATDSSGGDNSITYKWQANGVDIQSSNTATYDPPSGLTSTTTYTRYAKDGTCNTTFTASTGSWMVTVRPNSTSGAINTTGETICYNGDPGIIGSATVSSGGDNSITYKWQANGVDIPSSNAATYDPPSGLTSTTTYTRYAKDGTCNTTFTASTGSWVVTVNPIPASPTISSVTQPTCGVPTGSFTILNNYGVNYTYPISSTGSLSGITQKNNSDNTITTFTAPSGIYDVSSLDMGSGCKSDPSTVTISAPGAKIWTGTKNHNWFDDENWTDEKGHPTKAPTKDDCVTIGNPTALSIDSTTQNAYAYSITILNGASLEIAAKSSLTVTNNINVNEGGTFTLQDSAGLIQVNEFDATNNKITNTGNIKVNRNTAPASWNDYTYWSSPTSDVQTLFDFSPNSNPKYFLTYDNLWNYAYPKITKFTAGIGYAIMTPINATTAPQIFTNYQFIGRPNNGTITVHLASGTSTYSGKLVGNPYPSAISADDFILANKQNISGTIYFWTHSQDTASGSTSSNYATYNLCGGTGTSSSDATTGHGNHKAPKFYIASGQGFIVQTKGDIVFNNVMRVGITDINTNPKVTNDISNPDTADNTNFYRSATVAKPHQLEKHRIWLNLSDNNANFSQILLGYIESATNNYDQGFDGAYTNNDKFVLYSLIGTDPYTIQAKKLPFTDTDIIPLGFKAAVTGNATISIDSVDGLFTQGQNVFIEDKLTGTTHNLSTTSYTFNTDAGTFNDRFVIKYKDASTLGLDTFDESKNNIFITAVNHAINVKCDSENIQKVFVYDTLGRLIFENNNVNNFETTILNLTANQVYIVKAILANGKSHNKKVIY